MLYSDKYLRGVNITEGEYNMTGQDGVETFKKDGQEKLHREVIFEKRFSRNDEANHENTWGRSFQQRKNKYEALLIQTASSALIWFWSPADTYSLMKEYSEDHPTETFSSGHKAIDAIES